MRIIRTKKKTETKKRNRAREGKKNILLLNCANLCLREQTDRRMRNRKNRHKIRKVAMVKWPLGDDAAIAALVLLVAFLKRQPPPPPPPPSSSPGKFRSGRNENKRRRKILNAQHKKE